MTGVNGRPVNTLRTPVRRTRTLLGLAPGAPAAPLAALVAEGDRGRLRPAQDQAGAGGCQRLAAWLCANGHDTCYELRLSRWRPGSQDVLAVGRDMTAQLATEERLRHVATHDSLTELPNRLLLTDRDTLARLGGDEFVAVLPGTCDEAQIRLITGRLLAALQPPFEIEGHVMYVGASIGVAVISMLGAWALKAACVQLPQFEDLARRAST